MKIGLFHSSLPGYSETFIVSKIRGLISEGHDVSVFLGKPAREITDYHYVNPYPTNRLLFIVAFPWVIISLLMVHPKALKKFWNKERSTGHSLMVCLKAIYLNAHILKARKLDWLHFTFATFSLGREHVASSVGARLAVSLRGFDMGIYPLKHPGCYNSLWAVVDKVHTISDDLYALALHNGLPKTVPVQKIRPGILSDKLKAKANPGMIGSVCSIISVGRLEWKKGYHYALRAMKILKERGVQFNFRIAGAGTMHEELSFAIAALGLKDHVRLVGKLTHDEVFEFMQKGDIYIQPSVQEGFCNSLLEAQGTGLLCVATNAEGLPENVLDGTTGWIVPKRDYIALADKIQEILSTDQSTRSKIVSEAMERVHVEFRINRLVKEFQLFYSL